MGPFAEINRPRRHQHPHSCGDADHVPPDEHRTARSTWVNSSPSTPHTTRTAAPASLISILIDGAVGIATFAAAAATSGTNGGNEHGAGAAVDPDISSRACRRHPNTCCGQICQRRAISDTRAPGSSVSATIWAFSSADQRRRRPGPVRTSMRRKPAFASSLTSTITIARRPSLRAQPAHFAPWQKNGRHSALTQSRLTGTAHSTALSAGPCQ